MDIQVLANSVDSDLESRLCIFCTLFWGKIMLLKFMIITAFCVDVGIF